MTKNNIAFFHRRGFWLRQLSDCAESSFSEVLATLKTYVGGDILLAAKCMDGNTWQGQIDPKTPIRSISDVQALQTLCWQNDVSFATVIVPRGEGNEVVAHAQLAAVIGNVVLDIENGPGFYDQAPLGTIPAYFQYLRNAAPDSYIMSQPDPRNLESVHTTDCLPFIDGIAAQHYVGWSEVGWMDVVKEVESFDSIRALGKDTYVTLYGIGGYPTVSTFWRAVREYAMGFQAFRFGVMNGQQLQQFGALEP